MPVLDVQHPHRVAHPTDIKAHIKMVCLTSGTHPF